MTFLLRVRPVQRDHGLLSGGGCFMRRVAFEDYLVTREFAGFATDEEKQAVVRTCFAVGAADDEISSEEAHTINEIALELGLDRPTLNAIREAYVDQFAAIRAARRLARR